jgi:hypothetical protein
MTESKLSGLVFVKLLEEYLTNYSERFSHGKGQGPSEKGPSEQGHPGIMAYELRTRARRLGRWSTVQIPRRWSLE